MIQIQHFWAISFHFQSGISVPQIETCSTLTKHSSSLSENINSYTSSVTTVVNSCTLTRLPNGRVGLIFVANSWFNLNKGSHSFSIHFIVQCKYSKNVSEFKRENCSFQSFKFISKLLHFQLRYHLHRLDLQHDRVHSVFSGFYQVQQDAFNVFNSITNNFWKRLRN